jgi:hypothetical protein
MVSRLFRRKLRRRWGTTSYFCGSRPRCHIRHQARREPTACSSMCGKFSALVSWRGFCLCAPSPGWLHLKGNSREYEGQVKRTRCALRTFSMINSEELPIGRVSEAISIHAPVTAVIAGGLPISCVSQHLPRPAPDEARRTGLNMHISLPKALNAADREYYDNRALGRWWAGGEAA